MTSKRRESLVTRAYDMLLTAYPAEFRVRYGDEMRHVFVESWRRAAAGRSRASMVGFWLRTLRDVMVNAAGYRRDEHRYHRQRRPDRRGVRFTLVCDLLAGVRAARRASGVSVLSIAVLGLGGGAVTTIGAAIYGTLIRPLPYGEPERVVLAWGSTSVNGQVRDVVSGPVAIELQRHNVTLDALAAFKPEDAVVMRDGRPHLIAQLTATTGFFDALGLEPWLGRWFTAAEGFSDADAAVVVTHRFWREALGADSSAIGRRLELDGTAYTIVGVIEPGFFFPHQRLDVVVPLPGDMLESRSPTGYDYWLVGRLRPGVTVPAASADLNRVLSAYADREPRLANWSVLVEPMQEAVVQFARPALLVLVAAVAFVWLIALVNVTSLQLMHLTGRRHMLNIRRALGASTSRLAMLLLGECATVATMAFAVNLGLSAAAVAALRSVIPPTVPVPGSAAQVALAPAVLSLPVILLAGTVAALGFVLQSIPLVWVGLRDATGRPESVNLRTRTGTRRTLRVHNVLVGAELAVATVLLMAAGLSLRSARNLLAADTGLRPEGVLTLYAGDLNDRPTPDRVRFFEGILREIAAIPGVRHVGLNDYVPLQQEDDFEGVRFPDRPPPLPGQGPREEWRRVSTDYFAAAGVSLLRGRTFEIQDDATRPSVAVANRAFIERYFPGVDPIGREVVLTNREYGLTTIVGVVENVRRRGVDRDAPPVLYVPFHRRPRPNMGVFVRVDGDAAAFVEPVRAAIWRVDARQPIDRVATLDDVVKSSIGIPRLTMRVTGVLGALGLGLAGIGVFGVMAYGIRMRHREFGIRIAVGAQPGAIRSMVLRRSALVAAAGLAVGVTAALLLGRVVRGTLFGVTPADPITLAGVAVVLGVVSTAAAYVPARLASRVRPLDALRAE